MKGLCCVMAVLVSLLVVTPMSYADEGAVTGNDALVNLVRQLQGEIVGLQKELGALKGQFAEKPEATTALEAQVSNLKKEINAIKSKPALAPIVTQAGAEVPSWLEGTTFGGDILVRWESQYNDDVLDRQRGRVRMRYGIAKQLNDELYAKFRIVTGSSSDNEAAATTMGGGTSDPFPMFSIALDQAYLKYQPNYVENLTVCAGKIPINWNVKGWLWDKDINPDGIGESYTYAINDDLTAYVNLAQLIMTESQLSANGDSEVYVFQSGIKGGTDITWGAYGTAYWFDGFSEAGNAADTTLEGNPFVCALTGDLGFSINEIPIALYAQGAMNMNKRTKDGSEILHYAAGVTVNELAEQGDWQCGYAVAYMEDDVMPAGLTNGDLGYISSANGITGSSRVKASAALLHSLNVQYRLFPSTDLSLTVLVPHGLNGDNSETETCITKVQALTRF